MFIYFLCFTKTGKKPYMLVFALLFFKKTTYFKEYFAHGYTLFYMAAEFYTEWVCWHLLSHARMMGNYIPPNLFY